jgi:outer membrane receptor protein involved in Fe transport
MRSVGVFAQGEVLLANRLTLVAGARGQNILARTRATPGMDAPPVKDSYGTLVGSANALFRVSRSFSLIATLGRAFRSPNLVERFFDGPVPEGSGYQRASPALSPETSFNLDAGARFQGRTVALEAFLFRNTIHDGIRIAETGDSVNHLPVFSNVNVDRLRYSGLEVQGSATIGDSWYLSASHSRLSSRNLRDPLNAIGTSYSAKTVAEVGYRRGSGWATYTVRHNGRVTDDQIIGGPVGDVLPAFTVQTLSGGFCVVCGGTYRGTLTVTVENLGDVLYAEPANTSFFRPEPGRHFLIGWTIGF